MMENGFSHPHGRRSWSNDNVIAECGLARGTLFNLTKGRRSQRNTVERVANCFLASLGSADPRLDLWRDHMFQCWHFDEAEMTETNLLQRRMIKTQEGIGKQQHQQDAIQTEARVSAHQSTLTVLIDDIQKFLTDNSLVDAEAMVVQGNLPALTDMLSEVLASGSHDPGARALLVSKVNLALGLIAMEQLDLQKAYQLYQAACRALPCHETLEQAGTLAWIFGDYAAAADYEEQWLILAQEEFGPDHEETGKAHNNLGITKAAMADFTGANCEYVKALQIRNPQNGGDPAGYAKCLNNQAAMLIKCGKYKEAQDPCKRSLEIRAELLKAAGSLDEIAGLKLELSNSLHVSGSLSVATGNYEEGEKAHRKALSHREKYVGRTNLLTSQSLYEVGKAILVNSDFKTHSRLEEASQLVSKSLAIYRMLVGDHDGEYALRSCVLAHLHFEFTGDQAKALSQCHEHLECLKLWRGRWHPDTMHGFSIVRELQKSPIRKRR
jgi:tetratricopeptide (TPR) repeat protein